MIMVSRTPLRMLYASSLLLLLGLLLGNLALAMLSMPILFFLLFYRADGEMELHARPSKEDTIEGEVGEPVTIERRATASGPPGLVVFKDELRGSFSSRSGRSLGVLWKGRGAMDLRNRYELVPLRQGRHEVGPLNITQWDAYAMEEERERVKGDGLFVKAESRVKDMRRLRNRRSIMMLPMPVGYLSIMGAETTDFKEIREYRSGEGFRRVNWKASARRQRDGDFKPYVNEYEREGKRKVWLFLDCGKHMDVGSENESAMEHAGNLVRMISEMYLAADCMVGLVLFNAEGTLLPDTGRRQKTLIARMLFGLNPGSSSVSMTSMVRKLRGHLRGGNPLYIVVTSLSEENAGLLSSDLHELKGIGGKRSKAIVLNLRGFELSVQDDMDRMAARFMHIGQTIELNRLRKDGWAVIDWDPRERSPLQVVSKLTEAAL